MLYNIDIMTFGTTLILMILAHLISDFTLQGWLADGKQKSWWKKILPNLEETKYRFDYVMALFCHSLYWSIFICLPFLNHRHLLVAVLANTAIHMVVDDLKANRFKINLIQDQTLHFVQILLTAIAMFE